MYKLECVIGIFTIEKKKVSPHLKNYDIFFTCGWDSQSAADINRREVRREVASYFSVMRGEEAAGDSS